ncbi:MAG: hypothetical protein CVT48_04100 [Thermoplasmata archaeon HGW-Thermoplasmata-1]|nr:MAG: hypothetical protein CVT48_04100 [Thermoplasmata archaeon HGW-Thermoplasmata-1]
MQTLKNGSPLHVIGAMMAKRTEDREGKALVDMCREVVQTALDAGADAAEAFALSERGTSLSIENGTIGFSSTGDDFGIALRVLKNRRLGFSYFTDMGKAGDAATEALALSRHSQETGYLFEGASVAAHGVNGIDGIYDHKVERLDSDDGLDMVASIIGGAREENPDALVSGGGVSFGRETFAIANSCGLGVAETGTHIGGYASVVMKAGEDVTTGFEFDSSRAMGADFGDIGCSAASLATRSLRAGRIEPGTMDVVFTPSSFSQLLEFITAPALCGDRAERGESFYSGKIGAEVAPEWLSLRDDPLMSGGINSSAFDDEGFPSRQIELISGGILQGFLYDGVSADKYGKTTTSNGMRAGAWSSSRSFKTPPGVRARNLSLKSRDAAASIDTVSDVRRGILVHDIMGAHTSNPASGDFSISSSALFEIREGEVRGALKPVMIAGNMAEVLKNVAALGNDYRNVPGSLSFTSVYLPSVRCSNLSVTC